MDSQDPESRHGEEAAPLLGSNSNQLDDAFTDDHDETTPLKQPSQISHVIFLIGFLITLGLALATLGLLITQTVLSVYGQSHFAFNDWSMEYFRTATFWAGSISVVVHVANIIRLVRSRKPLPSLINFCLTLALAITFIVIVSKTLDERRYSNQDYCKPRMIYPWPEDPYPDPKSPLLDPVTKQRCLKWASEFEIFTLLAILFAGLHGLSVLTLTVITVVDLWRYRSYIPWPKNVGSNFGPGGLSIELSIHWGAQQKQNVVQHQPQQEQTLIDQ